MAVQHRLPQESSGKLYREAGRCDGRTRQDAEGTIKRHFQVRVRLPDGVNDIVQQRLRQPLRIPA